MTAPGKKEKKMRTYRKRRSSMFLFGRRAVKLTAAVFCALAIVTSQGLIEPAQAVQPDVGTARMFEPEGEYVPGEVLVLLSADVDRNGEVGAAEDLSGVEAAVDGQIERRVVFSRGKEVLRVKLPDGKSVENAIAENWGARDRRILVVEPNYRVRIARIPNDPRFPQLWGMHNTGQSGGTEDADIDAPEAWDIATGVPETSDVIVGIIDSGIDYLHPDLVANMWVNPGEIPDNGMDDDGNGYTDDVYGYDFFGNDSDPSDAAGHGTHCAGTIAGVGDNGLGVAGVNWRCKVMALRTHNASGYGSTSDNIEAIIYGVNNGAKILSNSWGGSGYSESLEFAIVYARDHGVLFVAAAGNYAWDTDSEPFYPASYEVSNVISVAATDDDDKLASFSNYGDESVDVGAPGVSILSTYPTYRTVFFEDFQGAAMPTFNGTQMAREGVGNYWGTVVSPTYYDPNNIAARGDWNHSWPYSPGSYGSIVTSPIDTRELRALSLYFEFRLECDFDDELAVYVWDGIGWREVYSISGPYYYYEDYFYGARIDIPDSYRNSGMKVRFRWLTDGVDNYYFGAEVDNIRIQCIDDNVENYAWSSGTSMAAPHVAGVAALVMANASVPAISLQELKTRLVWTGDPVPALDGRTVSGCRLNAYNALTATPGLKVVSPNGGENWELSTKENIQWYSIGGGPVVDIYLLKGGDVYQQLADDIPNDNKFAWKIPVSLPADSDYRIRITDGTYSDESDEDFELFCKLMKKPSYPDPCDGKTNVPLDTHLEWNFGGLEPVTITFDEVPLGMTVDGMDIEDVSFRFYVDEQPSDQAYVIGGSTFETEYIQIPCIDGDSDGILVLDFGIPVYGVSYGFLLASYGFQQNASTMIFIDSSYRTIDTFSADANEMGFGWMEGTNSGTSTKPIAHAVISFTHYDQQFNEFLLDNLMYNPIPLGSLPEAATQDENTDKVEVEGAEQQDVNGTDGDFNFLLQAEGPNLVWPEYILPDVIHGLGPGMKGAEAPNLMAMTEDVGVLHSGGPDAFGYIFIDSDEPNGPTFDWIEIASGGPGGPPTPPGAGPGAGPPPSEADVSPMESVSGTNLNFGDDDWYYPIPLPFKFSFYGGKYNYVAVQSNGTIYFVDRNMYYWNCCIPCDAGVNVDRFIAVCWDDLYPYRNGNDNVYFAIAGEAPNRILVVQWENVRYLGTDSRITCQVQLFEGSSNILMLYLDPGAEAGASATVGIQKDFGNALTYQCNERGLHPGLAILFKYEPPCPTTWDVYFGTEPNALELIGSDLTEQRFDPTPEPGETLRRGIRYYWQVVAKNCCSVIDGNDWSFSTENTPPVADAGDRQTLECVCNTPQGTQVTLDGARSSDAENTPLTYTWTGPFLESPVHEAAPTITLDSGCPDDYVITLVVNDGIEDSEPNEVVITVVDTVPPEFEFSVAPTLLWPPSHKMVEITPGWTVSDECDPAPDVSVVGIVMSEDVNTVGDGHTTDDYEIGDDGSIYVRSERSGANNGRIYTITAQAVDDSGNATLRSATVSIPHDMRVLAGIADRWLKSSSSSTIHEDLNRDGIVNLLDFAIFAQNWIR
jgi:subtilisin family serine protease